MPGRAEFTLETTELGIVEMLLDRDLSALAPLSLEGRLEAPRQGRWELTARG